MEDVLGASLTHTEAALGADVATVRARGVVTAVALAGMQTADVVVAAALGDTLATGLAIALVACDQAVGAHTVSITAALDAVLACIHIATRLAQDDTVGTQGFLAAFTQSPFADVLLGDEGVSAATACIEALV